MSVYAPIESAKLRTWHALHGWKKTIVVIIFSNIHFNITRSTQKVTTFWINKDTAIINMSLIFLISSLSWHNFSLKIKNLGRWFDDNVIMELQCTSCTHCHVVFVWKIYYVSFVFISNYLLLKSFLFVF